LSDPSYHKPLPSLTHPLSHPLPSPPPQRNQNPAALLRDRHSRSGLLKSTEQLRKNGAGAHNWGSFRQEGEAELAADADAMFEMEGDDAPLAPLPSHAPEGEIAGMAVVGLEGDKEGIARSPSESMSSVESDAGVNGNGSGHGVTNGGAKPVIGRRMSNVSEEERERARVYREGVMTKGKGGEW